MTEKEIRLLKQERDAALYNLDIEKSVSSEMARERDAALGMVKKEKEVSTKGFVELNRVKQECNDLQRQLDTANRTIDALGNAGVENSNQMLDDAVKKVAEKASHSVVTNFAKVVDRFNNLCKPIAEALQKASYTTVHVMPDADFLRLGAAFCKSLNITPSFYPNNPTQLLFDIERGRVYYEDGIARCMRAVLIDWIDARPQLGTGWPAWSDQRINSLIVEIIDEMVVKGDLLPFRDEPTNEQ